jgi:hypothetical protein
MLHKVAWTKGNTYQDICNKYATYVKQRYRNVEKTIVLLDGYSTNASTKDTAHVRRSKGRTGTTVLFNSDTVFNTKKEDFLSNQVNKQTFLEMFKKILNEHNINTIQAQGDADFLIIQTAMQTAKSEATTVIGEDTDLLILLIHYSHLLQMTHCPIFFKSDKQKTNTKSWVIKHVVENLGPSVCAAILPIHAFLGCDTTSRVYSIGKAAALSKCNKNEAFKINIMKFLNPEACKADIIQAGERLLIILYGGNCETLNQLRLEKFNSKVASGTKAVSSEMLCPTSDAASYHSQRVYHQVQSWTTNNLNPIDWGWKEHQNKLLPIYTCKDPAPPSLLKLIRCNCKGDCSKRICTCLKHNLRCSSMYGECRGVSCTNGHVINEEEATDEIF